MAPRLGMVGPVSAALKLAKDAAPPVLATREYQSPPESISLVSAARATQPVQPLEVRVAVVLFTPPPRPPPQSAKSTAQDALAGNFQSAVIPLPVISKVMGEPFWMYSR